MGTTLLMLYDLLVDTAQEIGNRSVYLFKVTLNYAKDKLQLINHTEILNTNGPCTDNAVLMITPNGWSLHGALSHQ